MSSEASEKTERPSEQRLRESRKKGQVAKSADIAAVSSLCCALLAMLFLSVFFFEKVKSAFHAVLKRDINSVDLLTVKSSAASALDTWLLVSLPILFAAGIGALVGNIGQFGFLFSLEPIKFDLKKISPLGGIKKLFSKNRLVELLKQVAKFAAVVWIIYGVVASALPHLILLFRLEVLPSLTIIGAVIKTIFVRVVICFVLIAIVDFFWQRHSFLKSMRMSKYEVKKEFIQQEGDPEIKHERRRVQQEALEALSAGNAHEASVVITNPSHIAVALRYIEKDDPVPRLISKGIGKNAKRIIGEARRMNIPIMRNVPLARDLQWLDINEEIPERLYDSVAEVLTFINELNAKHEKDTP